MYKEKLSLVPSKIYLNLNFECVKKELFSKFNDIQDLGDVIYTQNADFVLSFDNIGKVIILYNQISPNKMKKLVDSIEDSYKVSMNSFTFSDWSNELTH